MSIESDHTFDQVEISCDAEICGQSYVADNTTDFRTACDEAKTYGWKIRPVDGGFEHLCPSHAKSEL